MDDEKDLINIDLEDVKTLKEVSEVIRKIQNDNGSMKPFAFEINKELQNVIIEQVSKNGTIFGVPYKTVERIDKAKVLEVLKIYLPDLKKNDFIYQTNTIREGILKELGLEK